MRRLFQHHSEGILVDHLHRDVRLRSHALAFRREVKADHLPGVHPAVGQDGFSVREEPAAPELHRAGKVGRDGALAQKIAQQRAAVVLFGVRHRKV